MRVLENKTQGLAYHYALLAAAMVVEERFPQAAMAGGDIDRPQAEQARRLAAPILGRELPLPIRVDAARLVTRLASHYHGDALTAAFERAYRGEPIRAFEAILCAFPGEAGARWWGEELGRTEPGTVGATRLLVAWLNAERGLADACRIACLQTEGPCIDPGQFVRTLATTWLAVAPHARRALEPFKRPEGTAPTVWSLFGEFFLDAGRSGRHLRVSCERAAVSAALVQAFGEALGSSLDEMLSRDSATIERRLTGEGEAVQRLVKQAEQEGDDDTERLVTLVDPDAMGKRQRAHVHALVFAVKGRLDKLRQQPLERELLASIEKTKVAIARIAAQHGPRLMEDAWERIAGEDDPDAVAFWFALVSLSISELHLSQTGRALFENRALHRYAVAAARNPELMAEMATAAQEAERLRGADSHTS